MTDPKTLGPDARPKRIGSKPLAVGSDIGAISPGSKQWTH